MAAKIVISKCDKKYCRAYSIFYFSTDYFLGQGNSSGRGYFPAISLLPKVLPEVLVKCWINFGSSKCHQNCHTNSSTITR